MATKNDAEVIINGKVYKLSGYESEEYLQKIASYINGKIHSFEETESYMRLNQDVRNVLLNINLADDYFKAKKQADFIESDAESRDKQLYDVKHELVAAQLKVEALEKEVASLKEQLDQKEKENIRLDAELQGTKALIPPATKSRSKKAASEAASTEQTS